MKRLHKQIKAQIEKDNTSYKIRANNLYEVFCFQYERLSIVPHKKRDVLVKKANKLMTCKGGALQLLETVGVRPTSCNF